MLTPYVETDCTIEHNGNTFESGGAMVTDDYAIAYVDNASREYWGATVTLTNWHGEPIGTAIVTGKWRIPNGILSSHMFSYRATIDGRAYNMRGMGAGMVAKGKRAAS